MNNYMNARSFLGVILLASLAGCAHHYMGVSASDPYGFFSGVWHGITFPFALLANIVSWVISLFGGSFLEGIQIIGRPNTGFFYYLGFAFGFMTFGRAGF